MTLTKKESRQISKKFDVLLEKEDERHEKAREKIYTRKGRELTKALKKRR